MTSPAVRAIVEQQLRRELAVRLTHGNDAVLRRVPDIYRKIIGEALLAEQGGTGKAAQLRAAQRALDRIARIGVVPFVDQSGRQWSWQAYVEMAVRTAAMRARTHAQLEVYRSRGIGLVVVSDHAGFCPLCAPYDGRVLAIDERPAGPVQDGQGRRVEVVATVAEAIAAGLQHPNCRHVLRAFRPGVTVPPEPELRDSEVYEAQQHQRYLERQIRYWKTRAAVTIDGSRVVAAKVSEWQRAAAEHARTSAARRIYGREQIGRALPSPTPRR